MVINILIPIETSSRELLYKVFLCNLLAHAGFNCYLGSKSNIYHLAKHLKNYIYLDKGYHADVSEPLYEKIQENNGVIVNLDEEGAVDFSDNSTLKERYAPQLFDYTHTVFLWGIKQYELIKQNTGGVEKTIITGHPRFELLKPEFHYLYNQDVEKITQKHGSFILINTNMGFGNNIKGDDFVIENYGNRFKNIKNIVNFDKIKVNAFVKLIIELSSKVDKKIILRPHPEENLNLYVDAFKGIDNIKVIYSGSVVPWLLAADQIIHPDCTTAIESSFLGKLPISYMPENYPKDIVTKIPLEVSIEFSKISQVIEYLTNNQRYPNNEHRRHQVLEDYFSHHQPTTQLIINKLKEIKINNTGEATQKNLWQQFLLLRLKESYNSLRRSNDYNFTMKKLQGFDHEKIEKIQNVLLENQGLKKCKLKKYNKSLFMFARTSNHELRN